MHIRFSRRLLTVHHPQSTIGLPSALRSALLNPQMVIIAVAENPFGIRSLFENL